jgi:hypothetical protein
MRAPSILVALGLIICGCSVPVVQQVAAPEPQPLAPGAASMTLKLNRVIVEVPKGSVVGEQREGPECVSKEPLKWKADTLVYNEGEYHTAFESVLGQYNFLAGKTVKGRSTTALFDAPPTAPAGELLLGARITNVRQNDCMSRGLFNMHTPIHKGSVHFSVHWEVYAPKEQKVILAVDNEGSGALDEFKSDGDVAYFARAFSAALKGLLRNEEFRKLVTKK